ncbi:MAG: hypothetical protein O3B84_03455 [Chloroflexi bacterium]|nr:hypothetical protein [Chloroflexota bacterium]
MVFPGLDPSGWRDRAHAREIEQRTRDEERRRHPDRGRHEAEVTRGGAGRILWGKIILNVVGLAVAVGALIGLMALFIGRAPA